MYKQLRIEKCLAHRILEIFNQRYKPYINVTLRIVRSLARRILDTDTKFFV